MGWCWGSKPSNIREWLDKVYSGENYGVKQRCLDAAMVNMSEIYIAVEQTDKYGIKTVVADIMQIKFANEKEDGINYPQMGYNAYGEQCGVHQINCPQRILDLLTPTDDKTSNEWRRKCRERLEHRASVSKLQAGDYIQFEEPIRFRSGEQRDTFKIRVFNKKKVLVAVSNDTGETLFHASIGNWRDMAFKKLEEDDLPWKANGFRP
ncbi:DUF6927 domain-containing protein [Mesorhizobium sp. SP-1A]|uniref:DUF6927 domain-containing protein n=1 Tax=Mesorhizobium sp. SP-1A TaxID=3077840 RepID=UPI0028F72904|nr:hypothetical protein [Mesorhizobium sp. SP-1A]